MRSAAETAAVNNALGRAGLSTLDDPRGLLQQAAFLTQDHDDLRRLINKCEPQHRREMYEALKPHLSFEPKPLDVYIAELGDEAARKQLPTIGPDGHFRPFHVPELQTARLAQAITDQIMGKPATEKTPEEQAAQDAVDSARAKHTLTVTCRKCTRVAQFHGDRKADAIFNARLAGWGYDSYQGGAEICPECLEGN